MIDDLSRTLQAILDDPGLTAAFPELSAAQVSFDRPMDPYNPAQTTLNLYLYDIRENVELRDSEPVITRNNGQATLLPGSLRVACSYLLTAWPVGGTDLALQEQKLLGQALLVLSRYTLIPAKFLKGSLVGQDPQLPLMTSQMEGLKDPSDFWTALGNKLRTSISLTVTISMQPFIAETAPLVMTSEVRLGEMDATGTHITPATLQESYAIGGFITNKTDAPVANALVQLLEAKLTATTDADGQYSFAPVPSGSYTLRVKSGNQVKNVSITIPADLVAIPDAMALNIEVTKGLRDPIASSTPDTESILEVQRQLLKHCQEHGNRFAILDSIRGSSIALIMDQRNSMTGDVTEPISGALYYPWLMTEQGRFVPPCGHVAGIYSRSDKRTGVHKAPANEEIGRPGP
jgi:hypothetical protein